jgi:hypothetical protein
LARSSNGKRFDLHQSSGRKALVKGNFLFKKGEANLCPAQITSFYPVAGHLSPKGFVTMPDRVEKKQATKIKRPTA